MGGKVDNVIKWTFIKNYVFINVMDPDDPYVFGPSRSGSGSVSQSYGSGYVPKCHGSTTLAFTIVRGTGTGLYPGKGADENELG